MIQSKRTSEQKFPIMLCDSRAINVPSVSTSKIQCKMLNIIDTSSLGTVINNSFVHYFFKEKYCFFLKTVNLFALLGS